MRLMNSTPQTIVRYVRGVVPRGVQTMSDDNSGSTIELNRRRVLGALGTIGVASAGAGAGTFALFSDTESSTGNSISAGTLDLTTSNQTSIEVNVTDVQPGYFTSGTTTLNNAGSLDGSLDIYLDNVSEDADGGTDDTDPDDGGSELRFESTYAKEYGTGGRLPRNPSYIDVSGSNPGSPVAMEVVDNGGSPSLILEAPDESLSFIVDADGDGEIDYHLTYSPSDGWGYKTISNGTYSGNTLGQLSSVTYDDDDLSDGSVQVTFDNESFPIAVGGGSFQSGVGGGVPFVPGFDFSYDSNGDPVANADRCVTVDPTSSDSRHLADLLRVSAFFDDDQDGSFATVGDPGKVFLGKLSNVAGDGDLNEPFASSQTSDVVLTYDLPINAGNVVQGDEVSFDVVFELNQEDSQ